MSEVWTGCPNWAHYLDQMNHLQTLPFQQSYIEIICVLRALKELKKKKKKNRKQKKDSVCVIFLREYI